jgi:hypothetical protein
LGANIQLPDGRRPRSAAEQSEWGTGGSLGEGLQTPDGAALLESSLRPGRKHQCRLQKKNRAGPAGRANGAVTENLGREAEVVTRLKTHECRPVPIENER